MAASLHSHYAVGGNLAICVNGKHMDKYPAKAHARRVAEKLGVCEGLIALAGTSNTNWSNSDMPAPFRQDRYFYYLTGCNEPDCHVTYSIKEDLLTLWLPPVDTNWRHVVYYGNGSTVEEALQKYDIDEAKYLIPSWNAGTEEFPIFSLDGESIPLDSEIPKVSLRHAMDACRVIKDKHEIELIRRANRITAEAHVAVFQRLHTFDNEAQVEAAYMQVCIARRAKEQAYDPIAGSGPNAAVLHYSENRSAFGEGQTVVLDAGCEVERYASDVTRTFPINKDRPGYWPSPEAKQMYELVEKVQETCIKQMLPGKKYIEATWNAHHMIIDGLLQLGILKGDPDHIFAAGTSQAFLPHGLGHHMGLEVHDVSPVPPPPATGNQNVETLKQAFLAWRPEAAEHVEHMDEPQSFAIVPWCHSSVDSIEAPVLEPGMVVTIEPGIYFNAFLLKMFLQHPIHSKFIDADVLARYIPVGGVRIEDDILITDTGYENLTTAPKGEEMLKIIRRYSEEA